MMYKVSIIIPIYNVAKYLDECLDSAISQTMQEIEIICIDNGASEIERNIIKKFALKDSRIKVISFENNQGYGKAVNEALKIAQGEYISILESDDFIDSNMMEVLYKKAKEHDSDVIKSAYIAFDDYSEKIYLNDLNIPENKCFSIFEYSDFLSHHPSIWSCLYKRSFLIENNLFLQEAKNTGWVDNPFQVQVLLTAKKIQYLKDAFYHYRINIPTSSSSLKEGLYVPYNSSLQVHEVLKKLNVENKEIYKNLAIREWNYIKDIIQKSTYSEIETSQTIINNMFDMIGESLNGNNKFQKFRRKYYKKSIYYLLLKRDLKGFINKVFCMKIRNNCLTIRFLNKPLFIKQGKV